MKTFFSFRRLVQEAPRGWPIAWLGLMVLTSLTEGIGTMLLVPVLGLLGAQGDTENHLSTQYFAILQKIGLPTSLGGLLAIFLMLVGFRGLVQYLRERLGAKLQYLVVAKMRKRCFAALLRVEWRWILAARNSEHANLLLTNVSRVGGVLNFGLSLLGALVTLLAYLFVAFFLSWQITTVVLISSSMVFGVFARHRWTALRLGQGLGHANQALHRNVQESLAGIKLAKILGNESRHLTRFLQTMGRLHDQELRFMAGLSLSRLFFQVGGAILLTTYLYMGLIVWPMPLPELLTTVLLFSRMIPLFMNAHQHYYQLRHALPSLDEVEQLLDACQNAAEPGAPKVGNIFLLTESVVLNKVSVVYTGRDQPALDAVSIRFAARTTTAVIGNSGSGKSTLADVLMGLLRPDAGYLEVDGRDIDGCDRMTWRHTVAYVPQEVFLFDDSIRNNLLWASPEVGEDVLRRALKQAAADFVFHLPQGLDTLVGDGGTRLSGGERQRIGIARALLWQPSLLILDEATSALDVENECLVCQAINKLRGHLTVVIIGHRLPILEYVDQVVVLQGGRVSTQGSWQKVRSLIENVNESASN